MVCPQCQKSGYDEMWEGLDIGATGWRNVGDSGYEDLDVDYIEPTGVIGCDCGWQGSVSDLIEPVALGWDNKPLIEPMEGQLSLI